MEIKGISKVDNSIKLDNIKLNKDDVLNGEVVNIYEDKIGIEFDNFYININKNKLNKNIGDKVFLKVLDNRKNNISLQLISDDKVKKMEEPKIDLKKFSESEFIKDSKVYTDFLSKNKDNSFILKDIKYAINHISNVDNKTLHQNMANNFLNVEKNSVFTISDFISKSTGEIDENLEETSLKKESNVKMDLNMNGIYEEAILRFEEILLKNGASNSSNNIDLLKNLEEKIKNVDDLNENQIYNLVKNKDDITLNDIYKVKHSGFQDLSVNENKILNISNIDEKIEEIFSEQNIKNTPENLEIAKHFIQNEIEISKENFDKALFLKDIKNNVDLERVLNFAALNIAKNENILDTSIFKANSKNLIKTYKELVNILPQVKAEHIQSMINRKIPINLNNIKSNIKEPLQYGEITEKAILSRLDLAKIQMKLTNDAIINLHGKGINIDTKSLKEVISTLENIENETYKTNLKLSNVPINSQNLNEISQVHSSIQKFYPMAYATFGKILFQNKDISIKDINTSIDNISSSKIIETLNVFKTVPNISLGDKVNITQFQDLLLKNGFEVTENNLKAAKILSLNEIELNEENILKTKVIYKKIDYIQDKLHPLITSKMLKDKFNPLTQPIDNIINYIDKFSEEFGQTSREKIAEQILSIDDEAILKEEDREALISVYRMLNLIQNKDSKSIGGLLKSNKNLTLGNLLEFAKSYNLGKKEKIDKKVDDDFGQVEFKENKLTIKETISNTIQEDNLIYNKFIIEDIINYGSSKKLLKHIKNRETTIESLLENLNEDKEITLSQKTKENFINEINNIKNIDKETLEYALNNGVHLTLNFLNNLDYLKKGLPKISANLKDLKDDLKENNIDFAENIFKVSQTSNYDLQKAKETISLLEKENIEVFDEILNINNIDIMKNIIFKNKNVNMDLKFLKNLNSFKEGVYSLPIELLNGNIASLDMIVFNQKALNDKNFDMFLSLKSDEKSSLQTYVKITDNGTVANVTCEKDNFNIVKNHEKDIINILKKFDITTNKMLFSELNNINVLDKKSQEKIQENFINIENSFEKIV